MLKKLYKFFQLPIKLKFLYLEAFFYLGISRVIVLFFKFSKTSKIFGKTNSETQMSNDNIDVKKVNDIKKAIKAVGKNTFWDSKCLVQAYAAKFMLRKRNQPVTVYFGVAKNDSNDLIAHAWVRCGLIYVSGGENRMKFTITSMYS